jgi:hypothetical protein
MIIQKKILLMLMCFISTVALPQKNTFNDRKDLQQLLDERKAKFDSYTSSLDKRSGIFGNKTKKDIQASNEVLINIVQTDNRIISTLYRVIDLRNLETSNTKFDVLKQNQNYDNLLNATDTLSKQVSVLSDTNKALKSKTLKFQTLFYVALALLIFMLFRNWKKGRQLSANAP